MAPKSPNGNSITNTDKVDVDLNFVDDEILYRKWVDKDKFPEFHNDYNDSQENSSLTESSEVQFRVKTTIKEMVQVGAHLELKIRSVTAFTDMTTVYGGNAGIKLFLKSKIVDSVYKWEDSAKEILSMEIQNLYVNRKSVIKDYSLEQ